jgi:hypothetical protein
MSDMDDTFQQMLLRREREVVSRIDALRKELDPLESEFKQIQTAKRALGLPASGAAPVNGLPAARFMTMKQLVLYALKDHFKNGATGKQLVEFLKSTCGREIARESLSPQLSRLRAEKKIDRQGRIWFLTGASS